MIPTRRCEHCKGSSGPSYLAKYDSQQAYNSSWGLRIASYGISNYWIRRWDFDTLFLCFAFGLVFRVGIYVMLLR
jgi:hypothetical protein